MGLFNHKVPSKTDYFRPKNDNFNKLLSFAPLRPIQHDFKAKTSGIFPQKKGILPKQQLFFIYLQLSFVFMVNKQYISFEPPMQIPLEWASPFHEPPAGGCKVL